MSDRFARARYLGTLDPKNDCHEIHRIYSDLEFPWDYGRGLEIAVWKTCCVPEISAVLQESGHFERLGQKRYDDTRILLGEIVAHGYDSPRGRQAIKQINRAHRRFDLNNEDMLYVLSAFVYEPVAWIDRWAWRKVTQTEKAGSFYFLREIGRRMHITQLPEDYESFHQFKLDYERRRFRNAPSNERVGQAVLRLYSSWYVWPISTLIAATLTSRLDQRSRQAMGFPEPAAFPRAANAIGLRAHGYAELVAPRVVARLIRRPVARSYPGYPQGYDLSKIGPRELPNTVSTPHDTGAGPFSMIGTDRPAE